jgi:hypothetical protein
MRMSTRVVSSLAMGLAMVTPVHRGGAQAANAKGTGPALARFTVRIENVSTRTTLTLAKGGGLSMPLSPGVWAVHTGGNPILTPGKVEAGLGLKGLAEAGMAGPFADNLARVPGVRSHGQLDKAMVPRAVKGTPPSGTGTKSHTTEVVPSPDAPMLMPGAWVDLVIDALPGDKLSFAFMLGYSNDGIIGTGATGIALFDASGRPVAGDRSSAIGLWDAGTEVNEEPGIGRNQGMRQGAPTAGDPERRPVRAMSEAEFGSKWPAASRILRVTITPAPVKR